MQIIRATQYRASVECILYDDYCVPAPSVGHRSIMHVQVIFIPRFMYLCTHTLIHSISVYIRGNVCFPREQCEGQLHISDRKSFCVCSVNSHPIQHLAFT